MSTTNAHTHPTDPNIAFIGGGNMASAIIGGLLKRGMATNRIQIVEPLEEQRIKLRQQFGIEANFGTGPSLATATIVVWAVKPQMFKEAALQTRFRSESVV